ncbi:hypothetical protein KSK37_12760 [Kaistella sp. DKR-2]|nr:hypothetical protein [Kaistella soli]
MKVKLNGEYGIVTDEKIENNFGIILWDTEKKNDTENWCGQFGSFKKIGGIIISENNKFSHIKN